jgi:hypothetical protein
MRLEPLTEICKSSNNGDDGDDDIYFPTVQELIAGRGGGHAPKAVDKHPRPWALYCRGCLPLKEHSEVVTRGVKVLLKRLLTAK